ncbi:efflux RND transporter periplasmic adaptor subunit [Paenibacillus phocaensis]|uniref:efflux RND transporter periplasmic adaptor subunit n=1 Tax=Paenibacillus phocaensis TaxID=1776378 RepID=UPI0003A33AA6|nr:efflux RND transporter periplasmic adaptor subunit [Paenibacillus phocaensis]
MDNKAWKKLALGGIFLVSAAIIAAGCTKQQEPAPQNLSVSQKPTVKVSTAEKRNIGDPQEVVAEVASAVQRDIVVKAGGDVLKAPKKRGDLVNKGDLLFELDPADVLLQKQKAEISLRTAQENLKNGQFANSGDSSALQPLKDQVKLAQIGIEELNRTLKNYKVTAPISGILTDFSIEAGMTINPGTVGKVQQINPVTIKANITEDHAKLIRGKTELQFYTSDHPDSLMKARIDYLADIMDTQQRTYALELKADNADLALKPGTKVQLQLTDQAEQEVLTIPTTAIIREGSDTFAYVVTGGKVEKRTVRLGRLNEMYQEIIEGIEPGEQVAVSGQHQLKDQQLVEAIADK